MRISEKTTENSEWLGRQALPGFEPGTPRLPALRAVPLHHWWGLIYKKPEEIYQVKLQFATTKINITIDIVKV